MKTDDASIPPVGEKIAVTDSWTERTLILTVTDINWKKRLIMASRLDSVYGIPFDGNWSIHYEQLPD